MATILQLKVAKRRFFEKVSLERCERQPPGTVTLLEQWKQRYLPNTHHAKREGRARNKLSELSGSESKPGMT